MNNRNLAALPEDGEYIIKVEDGIADNPRDWKKVCHGHWLLDDTDMNTYECSACKGIYILEEGTPQDNDWNYCPNCGAKMEEAEE